METGNLSHSFRTLKRYLFHPAGALRIISIDPDIPGALIVIDAISFFTVLGVFLNNFSEITFSFSFFINFIVMYITLIVLFCLLVAFEAGVVFYASGFFRKNPDYASLYTAFGYAKLPLLISTLLYILLPSKLGLSSVIDPSSFNVIGQAFIERAELFELMTLVLGVLGVRMVTGLTIYMSIAISVLLWLLGTPLFYCVMNAFL
jgi:hypothetical protein